MTAFLKCARHVDAWYNLGANEQSARVSSSPQRYGPLLFFKKAGNPIASEVAIGKGRIALERRQTR